MKEESVNFPVHILLFDTQKRFETKLQTLESGKVMRFKEIETKLDDFFNLSKFNEYVETINKNTIFDKEIFQQMIINTKKVYENEKFLANLIDSIQNNKSIKKIHA